MGGGGGPTRRAAPTWYHCVFLTEWPPASQCEVGNMQNKSKFEINSKFDIFEFSRRYVHVATRRRSLTRIYLVIDIETLSVRRCTSVLLYFIGVGDNRECSGMFSESKTKKKRFFFYFKTRVHCKWEHRDASENGPRSKKR